MFLSLKTFLNICLFLFMVLPVFADSLVKINRNTFYFVNPNKLNITGDREIKFSIKDDKHDPVEITLVLHIKKNSGTLSSIVTRVTGKEMTTIQTALIRQRDNAIQEGDFLVMDFFESIYPLLGIRMNVDETEDLSEFARRILMPAQEYYDLIKDKLDMNKLDE